MYKFWMDDDTKHQTNAYLDRWGSRLVVESTQDCADIIEDNRAHRNVDSKPFGKWRRVAQLPNVVVEQLMRDGIWWDRKAFRRWLNDPNNRYFRTNTEYV
jgi:hypothetical protein